METGGDHCSIGLQIGVGGGVTFLYTVQKKIYIFSRHIQISFSLQCAPTKCDYIPLFVIIFIISYIKCLLNYNCSKVLSCIPIYIFE